MAKQKENNQQHDGFTIFIRRELQEYEKKELKELIDEYEYRPEDGDMTIGFF